MLSRFRGKPNRKDTKRPNHTHNGSKVITMPLTSMEDVALIEMSIENGNIIILSIVPLKFTQLVVVKRVVQTLNAFVRKHGGDIAQLGRDFIIVVPPGIDLAFPVEPPKKPRDVNLLASRYDQKGRGDLPQRGGRPNMERLQGEYQRGLSRSEVEQALDDPIFGL